MGVVVPGSPFAPEGRAWLTKGKKNPLLEKSTNAARPP
jgi:hypothetical protein